MYQNDDILRSNVMLKSICKSVNYLYLHCEVLTFYTHNVKTCFRRVNACFQLMFCNAIVEPPIKFEYLLFACFKVIKRWSGLIEYNVILLFG